jgi:hypothetical protein
MRHVAWITPLLLTATMAIAGPEASLPPDVNLVVPDDSVPAAMAKYSGRWSGTWTGGGDRLNHVLIVEKISPEGFVAIYAWGDSLGQNGNLKAGWRRINGTVDNGKLTAKLGQASVSYVLNPDGTINGTYTNARGFDSKATLKKDAG